MDLDQAEKENQIELVEVESEASTLAACPDQNSIDPPWRAMKTEESELSKEAGLEERYEVLCRIGEGGMGNVYKVMDKMLGKVFAIKVLRSDLAKDRNVVSRFKQEALAASRLTHVNLASVYSSGESRTGAPYLVMDFLEGPSLEQLLRKEGHLEPKKALNVFIEICDALEHAHAKGVIHRDLKPGNIILVDNEERVKIVDFGIAKVLPKPGAETLKLTFGEEVLGSPIYMSPEQCRGDQLDIRSDIYSFGCMMYETVCGRPPFVGDNPIKTILKHLNENTASLALRLKDSELPRGFEYIILKCLQKDPEDRYQTVFDLRMDLQNIKDNKVIKQKTFNRKLRWLAPASTAMLVVAVFILGFSVVADYTNPDKSRRPLDFPSLAEMVPFTSKTVNLETDPQVQEYTEQIETAARQFPRDDQSLADAEYDLTVYLIRKGDLSSAELHCRRIMDLQNNIDNNLALARYQNTMGYILERQHRFADASVYFEKSALSMSEALGEENPIVGLEHNRLAIGYERNRFYETAERHYLQAFEIFKKRFGEKSNEMRAVLNNLVGFYKHRRMPEHEKTYQDRLDQIPLQTTQHYIVDSRENPHYDSNEYARTYTGLLDGEKTNPRNRP